MKQIGVQKIFWDAFELAVSLQAKRLAKDIADTLGVDSAPLLNELKEGKVGVYLFDSEMGDSDPLDMRCKHCMPVPQFNAWRTPCMEPVLWSANPAARKDACLEHSLKPELRDPKWKEVIPYKYDDVTYYIDVKEAHVYSDKGTICGKYDAAKNTMTIFEIVED